MSIYGLMHDDGPLGQAFRDGRSQAIQWSGDRKATEVINRYPVGSDEWKAWNVGWNTAPTHLPSEIDLANATYLPGDP